MLDVPKRSIKGRLSRGRIFFFWRNILRICLLVCSISKFAFFLSFPVWKRNKYANAKSLFVSPRWASDIAASPESLHVKRGLPQRGKKVVFRSLGKKTWASLSLDDFKAPELEYVMLRILQAQEAWARGRYGQSGFNQVFMAETYFSRQTKFPSAAVASNSTHGRQYKLSLKGGLLLFWIAVVLSAAGCPVHLYWDFLCYYHHQILVLIRCFLGCSFLFSSVHDFSIICLLNAIACNFPGWKDEAPLKTVMEHPQVETGPEQSRWHRAFNLLNISGLMAIQHDWWLPASSYCYGSKGCLPLADRKLSWATHRAISPDLPIFFFPPKTPQLLRSISPWRKNDLSVSVCLHICSE